MSDDTVTVTADASVIITADASIEVVVAADTAVAVISVPAQGPQGLTGSQGLPGVQGPEGDAGPPGPSGPGIISGTASPPSSLLGNNGDFYLSTQYGGVVNSYGIFGPKTAGSWGSGHSLQGAAGIDGRTILSGSTSPSNLLGNDGDIYLNTATSVLYGPKASGAWPTGVSLVGVNGHTIYSGSTVPSSSLGADGDIYLDTQYGGVVGSYGIFGPKASGSWGSGHSLQGAAGIDGATIRYGSGPPSSLLGNDQDAYIDVGNWKVYAPKATGLWPPGVSMIGPTGPQGIAGNTIISGVGGGFPSSSLGVNGDYYIDYSVWKIFGPKASGAWPAAVNIVGPQGPSGAAGADGNTVLSGSGDPSSGIGVNGNFYINTTSWKIFGPKTSGAWGSGINMLGTSFAQQNHELIYTSATQITLIPKNGNTIKIAGSVYNLASGGLIATNSGKSASTLYYVYAFVSAGTPTLEMSTTGHVTDTTAGNEGIEVKSGDNTRTLVGMVYTNGSAQFTDNVTSRLVRSWMNDRGISGMSAQGSVVSTTSTSLVELDTGMRCSVLLWANEMLSMSNVSQSFASVANTIAYNYCLVDSASQGNAGIAYSVNANTQAQGVSVYNTVAGSDGIHTLSMGMASSSASSTANYASRGVTFNTVRRY